MSMGMIAGGHFPRIYSLTLKKEFQPREHQSYWQWHQPKHKKQRRSSPMEQTGSPLHHILRDFLSITWLYEGASGWFKSGAHQCDMRKLVSQCQQGWQNVLSMWCQEQDVFLKLSGYKKLPELPVCFLWHDKVSFPVENHVQSVGVACHSWDGGVFG